MNFHNASTADRPGSTPRPPQNLSDPMAPARPGRRFESWFLAAATAATLLSAGCATEDEIGQTRPWARPKGWETGIPTSILEGR